MNKTESLNNQKLISSIQTVLEEKQLLEPLRNYSDVPLETLIAFLYESHYKDKDKEEVYRIIKKESFFRTKRRWVKSAIKNINDPSAPNKELRAKNLFLQEYINKFGTKQFEREFKVKSLSDYIERATKELQEWAENDVLPIYSYPYFEEKTPRQHKTSIQIDLLMIIGEFLISNTAFFKPTVYQSPNFAINTSFFGVSGRGKLDLEKDTITESGDGDPGVDVSYHPAVKANSFGTNKNTNVLVSTDFVNDLNKKVPDLDTKDFELFLDVLNYRDANFQTNRRIQFPLKKLVTQIYGDKGGKNYEMTTERLLKLANYRITETTDDGEYFVKGLFSSVKIQNDVKDKSGGKIVTAYVSEDVYDDYLRQKVVSIYSEKVEELKGHFAYHLVFVLQKERLLSHQMNEANPVARKWLDFRYAIRFNRRTKKENLAEFEKAVAQIKEQQFLIQDYYRSGEYYFFTFFPLSSIELEDYSPQSNAKLN